jgi:hypothetical protein
MSFYSPEWSWDEWFDPEAVETERMDADLYMRELGELAVEHELDDYYEGDLGGVLDGMGNVTSDADPGL